MMSSFAPQKNNSQNELNVETESVQFMLAELSDAREELRSFTHRFENLLNFYFTALTAVLTVSVLFITQLTSSTSTKLSLALVGIGVTAFSLVIFLRLCITRTMMVRLLTRERRHQEFFLQRHNYLRKYASVVLTTASNNWPKWQQAIYTPQTVALFYVFALFIALLASLSSDALVASIFEFRELPVWQFSGFYMGWYIGAGVATFLVTISVCTQILKWQRAQAEQHAMWMLDDTLNQ